MSITLGPVTLPDDLLWIDEHQWSPAQQTAVRRLDGGLALFALPTPSGRPITLEASADAWLTRAEAAALHALAAQAGGIFLFTAGERTDWVMFRHQDPPAVDLRPLIDWSGSASDDPLVGQIKLMTI